MATFAKISEAFAYSTRYATPPEPAIIAAPTVGSVVRNPRPEFVNRQVKVSFPTPIRCKLSSEAHASPVITSGGGEAQSSPLITSGGGGFYGTSGNSRSLKMEDNIEKVIYGCRFLTLFGVFGSLIGSILCFIKGCTIVAESFIQYFALRGRLIVLLVEAIDVYLLGTVMLVFGMGLYELFVSDLDIAKSLARHKHSHRSNLFGLFTLVERPRWLEIKSVNELKTKLGHVIVMLLLIGLFDKSKKAAIHSPTDLLCFSASVLLSSGCLYLLSKLNGSK